MSGSIGLEPLVCRGRSCFRGQLSWVSWVSWVTWDARRGAGYWGGGNHLMPETLTARVFVSSCLRVFVYSCIRVVGYLCICVLVYSCIRVFVYRVESSQEGFFYFERRARNNSVTHCDTLLIAMQSITRPSRGTHDLSPEQRDGEGGPEGLLHCGHCTAATAQKLGMELPSCRAGMLASPVTARPWIASSPGEGLEAFARL